MARVLDGLGHRRSHRRHRFAIVAPRARVALDLEDWDATWHEGLSDALRALRENEAFLELPRLRLLEEGERSMHRRRRALERGRASIERSHERIERSMERLQERLDRLDAGEQSEVSDRLKERLRDMLRELKR